MSTSVKAIIVAVMVLALGLGIYAVAHKDSPNAANPTTNTSPSPKTGNTNTATDGSSTSAAKVAATITFTDSGFSPADVTVNSGDTIQIINNSSQPLQLDSDPHPEHTDDEELNVGEVDAGESRTFVLTTKGTWGYHDHLASNFTGTIHVK